MPNPTFTHIPRNRLFQCAQKVVVKVDVICSHVLFLWSVDYLWVSGAVNLNVLAPGQEWLQDPDTQWSS
jgi:hypothetical protein